MLFLIVHPEWRNWQTRWTQKRTSAAFQTSFRYSRLHKVCQGIGRVSSRLALLCSFLLILWLQISQSLALAQERRAITVPFESHAGLVFLKTTLDKKPVTLCLILARMSASRSRTERP